MDKNNITIRLEQKEEYGEVFGLLGRNGNHFGIMCDHCGLHHLRIPDGGQRHCVCADLTTYYGFHVFHRIAVVCATISIKAFRWE